MEWYSNKDAGIFFDNVPCVGIRYTIPSMSMEERRGIEKYPFICRKELNVELKDYKKEKIYRFMVPKGYCYDGASIPRFFWRFIGSNTDNRFLIAALIHDYLCENHSCIDGDCNFSTAVFNALLEASGVNSFQRFLMKKSVGCFQNLFCGWKK